MTATKHGGISQIRLAAETKWNMHTTISYFDIAILLPANFIALLQSTAEISTGGRKRAQSKKCTEGTVSPNI